MNCLLGVMGNSVSGLDVPMTVPSIASPEVKLYRVYKNWFAVLTLGRSLKGSLINDAFTGICAALNRLSSFLFVTWFVVDESLQCWQFQTFWWKEDAIAVLHHDREALAGTAAASVPPTFVFCPPWSLIGRSALGAVRRFVSASHPLASASWGDYRHLQTVAPSQLSLSSGWL